MSSLSAAGTSSAASRQHQPPSPPQQYEISLLRILESRSTSLTETFLTLDANRDGYINRTDLKVVLHNVLGIDLTTEQLDGLYARFCYFEEDIDAKSEDNDNTNMKKLIRQRGIRYQAFVDYITATTASSASTSMYGSTLALSTNTDIDNNHLQSLEPIIPTRQQRATELRKLLGDALRSHTVAPGSPSTGSAQSHAVTTTLSGRDSLNDAALFLKIDTHRTGSISLEEFTSFVRDILGYSNWSDEDIRLVLGEHYHPHHGVNYDEFMRMVFELEGMDFAATSNETENQIQQQQDSNDTRDAAATNKQADALLVGTILRVADESLPDGEIIRLIAETLYSNHIKLVDAFRRMETDHTGKLSGEELHRGLEEVGLGIGQERLDRILTRFGGRLTLSEFVRLISSSGEEEGVSNTCGEALYPAVCNGLLANILRQEGGEGIEPAVEKSKRRPLHNLLDEEDVAAILSLREAFEKEKLTATKAFQKIDRDHSRGLDAEDLRRGFEAMGLSISDDHIDHIMRRFDKQGVGKLKYPQFVKLLSADLGV